MRAADQVSACIYMVTPQYFGTMRIPIIRGREFWNDDTRSMQQSPLSARNLPAEPSVLRTPLEEDLARNRC